MAYSRPAGGVRTGPLLAGAIGLLDADSDAGPGRVGSLGGHGQCHHVSPCHGTWPPHEHGQFTTARAGLRSRPLPVNTCIWCKGPAPLNPCARSRRLVYCASGQLIFSLLSALSPIGFQFLPSAIPIYLSVGILYCQIFGPHSRVFEWSAFRPIASAPQLFLWLPALIQVLLRPLFGDLPRCGYLSGHCSGCCFPSRV